jgi:hypothetical protein
MLRSIVITGALAALGLAACSKGAQSPRPEHSAVADAMPQAAATPGATGPGAAAPHAPPPQTPTLSDTHPEVAGANTAAQPATGGMAAAGSINDLDRATPNAQSSGKANAQKSP